jgi:poly-beta-1,6-N-acetyl-D-glucosamine biosynthesis protein PgaD
MVDERKDDLIISRPRALSTMRKGTEMTVTAVGWIIWAVLCRPLLLAFLWFLGFKNFYEHMIRLKGMLGLADLAFIYFTVVFALYLLIRGWNSYNAWKFKGRERRVRNPSVSAQDLERLFNLPAQTVEKAQTWKGMTVDFEKGDALLLKESVSAL